MISYVADFNIKHEKEVLKNTDRIDAEMDDAKCILASGGRIAFLAHQGRFASGDVEELDFVLPYLSSKLDVDVAYYPENNTPAACDFALSLQPGGVAVMGNTRKHEGEEKNNCELAHAFAQLGDRCAIGGFGKAHRSQASNVGIQEHIPCYITHNHLDEMKRLAPWTGAAPNRFSVAVLGGVKKEKITTGLAGFAKTYDAVIPGGIVLNTILKVLGREIGDSLLHDGGKTFEPEVAEILKATDVEKIHIPQEVIVANCEGSALMDAHPVKVSEGVPDQYMIVDYVLPETAVACLQRVAEEKGRLLLAGTPGIVSAGFCSATNVVVASMKRNSDNCIVLGGDTAAEVCHQGPTSTGGGSALHFSTHGTTTVFEALIANRQRIHS